jgi:hypothetical protein
MWYQTLLFSSFSRHVFVTFPLNSKKGLPGHGLADEHLDHVQRFDPNCPDAGDGGLQNLLQGSVGFFCCKFVKTASVIPTD